MQANKSLKVALMFSAIGQYSTRILGFVSIMILARLLSPDEIGVFAVAGTAVVIATELSAFGVGQYLIREKEINEDQIRSVLGMAVFISWGLGMLLILSAPYLAIFYDKSAVKNILWILSASFFVVPFFTVPAALWRREMQFGRVAVLQFTGELVTAISSVCFVLLDFSYYGLAIGTVIGMFARLAIAIYLRPSGVVWLPKFTLVRNLLKFGFFTSISNVFARFSEGIPDLVIGKMGSMADVGYFSRGFGAVQFLNKTLISAVAPIILPHLSRVKRSGGSVPDAYLRSLNLLLAFTLPIFAVAGAASYPMIIGLFGDQWGFAVPIASILSIWVMFNSVHSFSSSAFIVSGDEKLMLTTGILIAFFRLVLVVLAASKGLEMVAWAMVVSGIIEFIVYTLALKKSIGLKINKMVAAILPNLFIALVCWLTTLLIDHLVVFRETNPFQSIAILAVSLSILWLSLLRIIKHEAWHLIWGVLDK